jgi:hypothetical protein
MAGKMCPHVEAVEEAVPEVVINAVTRLPCPRLRRLQK